MGYSKKAKAENRKQCEELIKDAAEELDCPPKVAQMLMLDKQGLNPELRNKSARELAAGWGVATEKVEAFMQQREQDFPLLKRRLGNALGAMVAMSMDNLMADLNDPEVMSEQTPEQKSRIVKNMADAWMTIMEGAAEKKAATAAEIKEMLQGLSTQSDQLKALMDSNAKVIS